MRHPHDTPTFEHLIEASHLRGVAKDIARTAFTDGPARLTESGSSNVPMRRPSRKTGTTHDLESRTLEDKMFLRLEHDPEVLWFVTQPGPQVELRCEHCNKPWVSVADFFALWDGRAGWIECRTEERIGRMLAKHPGFYVPTEQVGHYRCPAGSAYAASLGLEYDVVTPAAFNAIYSRNLDDLEEARRAPAPDPELIEVVAAMVARHPNITKAGLTANGTSAATIDVLLANGLIYADLTRELVSDPEHLHLYIDAAVAAAYRQPATVAVGDGAPRPVTLEPGARLLLGDQLFEMLGPGITSIVLRDVASGGLRDVSRVDLERLVRDGVVRAAPFDPGAASPSIAAGIRTEIYQSASRPALTAGADRAAVLAAQPRRRRKGEPQPKGQSARTIRRWRKRQRDLLVVTGDPVVGLVPKPRSGGGRQLEPRVRERLVALIERHVVVPNPLGPSDIRRLVAAELKDAGLVGLEVPAERTVARWMKRVSRQAKAMAQLGRRGANAVAPYREGDPDDAPANSDRPWQVVHQDSTRLDIETVCPETGRVLGRPWVTVGIDGFSGMELYRILHYEAPSTATTLRALRKCVELHGRLMLRLVVDQGAEFRGSEFERFLAWAEVTLVRRPPAEPRFGSPVERYMLELARVVRRLAGQTTARKNPRMMSKSVDPSALARWDIRSLDHHLETARKVLMDADRVRQGESRGQRFERGILELGVVPPRLFSVNDPGLLAWTLPMVEGEQRMIDSIRGINADYLTYWNDALARPELDGRKVEVRYDPADMSRVWALLDGRWLECHARELRHSRVVSAAEWQALSVTLRERHRRSAANKRVTGSGIAGLIRAGIETEELLEIRLQRAAERATPIQRQADDPGLSSDSPFDTSAADDTAVGAESPDQGPDVLAEGDATFDPRYFEGAA